MQPKKFSEYTPITETDGSEVIPILKAGVNATVKSEDLPISTATQTAIDAADADIAAHVADLANPHQVTKTQVGLGNVDNTSDANKPVSTAQATAIALKADTTYVDSQDALKADQATTYTKTEVDTRDTAVADTAQSNLTAHTSNTSNPHATTKSQVGLGNADNTSDVDKPISAATQTALDAKATNTALDAHTNNTSNPHSVTKSQVGLGNADNTSDADKPVSTAQQTALNGKLDKVATINRAYTTDGSGAQTTRPLSTGSAADSVAIRDANGRTGGADATSAGQYATKGQMDTADALKVNKAGDTISGNLTVNGNLVGGYIQATPTSGAGTVAVRDATTATTWVVQAAVSGNLGISNTTNYNYPLVIESAAPANALRLLSDRLLFQGLGYITGTGFPNGVVSAPVGSIYIDKAITNGASSWIKKSGTGNTGWQVLEGDTGWRNVSSLRDIFWSSGTLQVRRVGQQVYFRCWGVTVADSPTGLRTSGRTLLTTGLFPTGFRYASSWGTSTAWIGSVVLANRSGRVSTGNSYEDLSASIPNGEATPGSWTAGDIVSGQFSYTTTDSWPTTLPGTAA